MYNNNPSYKINMAPGDPTVKSTTTPDPLESGGGGGGIASDASLTPIAQDDLGTNCHSSI